MGAIAAAAILTFLRCTSAVIGSPRRSSAFPPSAIRMRMIFSSSSGFYSGSALSWKKVSVLSSGSPNHFA